MSTDEQIECVECGSEDLEKLDQFEHPPPTSITWKIRKMSSLSLICFIIIACLIFLITILSVIPGYFLLGEILEAFYPLILFIFILLIIIMISGIVVTSWNRRTIISYRCKKCQNIFEITTGIIPLSPRKVITWENGKRIEKILD